MKKIVFFTGAGISAESGVKTFRDNGGLWNEYKVEDVAHINGWRKNKELVLEFYNKRRAEMPTVEPNLAHKAIAELQASGEYEVHVVTQNVDDLHERAGSTGVLHLHGELKKARSTVDPSLIYEWTEDIKLGDKCEKGSQLRPHVTWFGEPLDYTILGRAKYLAEEADIFVVVGTSMAVQPAASIPFMSKETALIYYINPDGLVDVHIPSYRRAFFYHVMDVATTGVQKVIEEIKSL